MQRRDRGIAQSLGIPLTKRIKESRVLLVGAGGIGCELLKNLVCCGFGSGWRAPPTQEQQQQQQAGATEPQTAPVAPTRKAEIVVVDLDTIDLSNLNRQFLFRKQHIKKPKATVAKETVSQFNPSVNIDAHFASIYDSQYNVEFFEGFDLVFNALDNLAARRHVNRMCLAADVPLIESGTTGFNGQVQAIRKGVTECYDCNEKPVQKSYPICTIRSTPSQPIHCIVWAKSYLLPELFGASEDDESTDVAVTEHDNVEEVAKLKEEAEALKNIRSLMGKSDFAEKVFNLVFHDDIERLRSMTEMWTSRPPPTTLSWSKTNIDKSPAKHGLELSKQDQAVWTLQDNMKVFCYSIGVLCERVKAGETSIEFDKDDKDTLDFVTAAANLRSQAFGIPLQSEWDIKQMAGNIIPAIATSNALTASLCVMQAFKIIRSQVPKENRKPSANAQAVDGSDLKLGGSKMVFLTSKHTDRIISSEGLSSPRPDCPVCSPCYAKLVIAEDGTTTLQELVELLKLRLNYEDFSITADIGMIYDPDLDDNLEKPLKELGIDGKGTGFITVTDDSDEPKVDLMLSVSSKALEGTDKVALVPDTIILPPKPIKKDDNSDLSAAGLAIAPPTAAATSVPAGSKRKRGAEDDIEADGGTKKAKATNDEVLVIDDDGTILLD
ncbi:related to ubiquitin-activating enzyme homolog UBA2 [Ramularia collo-cygni]|uniref:Ubiquitin-activating enzyme E1-like n=1 Tax=Ramularia collo-cygni TaxID=112498 RepID=A0A2D3VA72_9PEZI|nr:related to ubiquitin-activating enzyme homolog UBA2 [Ramularia collo-cygni]CZT20546.1 related to ubiquitin-activating enzyme homolog UBA2 [Ramularia collo-cygni]